MYVCITLSLQTEASADQHHTIERPDNQNYQLSITHNSHLLFKIPRRERFLPFPTMYCYPECCCCCWSVSLNYVLPCRLEKNNKKTTRPKGKTFGNAAAGLVRRTRSEDTGGRVSGLGSRARSSPASKASVQSSKRALPVHDHPPSLTTTLRQG